MFIALGAAVAAVFVAVSKKKGAWKIGAAPVFIVPRRIRTRAYVHVQTYALGKGNGGSRAAEELLTGRGILLR